MARPAVPVIRPGQGLAVGHRSENPAHGLPPEKWSSLK